MTRRRRLLALGGGLAVLVVAVLVVGVLGLTRTTAGGPRPHVQRRDVGAASRRTTPTTIASAHRTAGQFQPVAPETTVPADTPVQQSYDEAFARSFASGANRAELARVGALSLPAPAIGGGWPTLPVANSPGAWARRFVTALLTIDFASRSRAALGPWLVAEEAPDLMPGVPAADREGGLYATVLDPTLTGQASPIPSAAAWRSDASERISWSVADLEVGLDPGWQAMVDAGWQPVDLRSAVEDVSGVLVVRGPHGRTAHRFSLSLQVGSAHFHPGYGSVLLGGWQES